MFTQTRNKKFTNYFYPCLGGILGGISVSSHFWLLLMPISLFILCSRFKKKISNFSWGFFFVLISHSWLYDLHPLTWLGFSWVTSLAIAISILLVCSLIGGLLVYLWGLLGEIIFSKEDIFKMKFVPLTIKVFLLSLSWGLGELILSQTHYFWIGIGESLVPGDMYLAGLARLIGASGLCVVQILMGFWMYLIYGKWKRKSYFKKSLIFGLLLICFLHLLGGLIKPIDRKSEYPVAIWQTNFPTREKTNFNDQFIKDKLVAAQKSALLNKAKLLVAPEGTLSSNFNLSKGSEINMLVGGFRNYENQLRSSLLGYRIGDQIPNSFIDKNRLVPIGEEIPGFLKFFSRGLSAVGGVQQGPNSRFFDSNFSPPLAVAICYEISNGFRIKNAINMGAKLIISVANLDPYPTKLHNQFISIARIRSIENRKDNLLVSNTGPSGLISGDGKIIQLFNPNTEQNKIVFPNTSIEKTFYTRFGEKPLLLLFVFFLGLNLFFCKSTN